MTKMTKKVYQTKQAEINNQIEVLENLLKSLPLETEGIPQHILNLIGDTWNNTHDEIDKLNQELKFLDQAWSRRNWTNSEYVQHELITNNID